MDILKGFFWGGWFVGLLGCWVVGLLGCWVVGLLSCWTVELLVSWFVALYCYGQGSCWLEAVFGNPGSQISRPVRAATLLLLLLHKIVLYGTGYDGVQTWWCGHILAIVQYL